MFISIVKHSFIFYTLRLYLIYDYLYSIICIKNIHFYSEQNIILFITIHLMPCTGGVTDQRMHNMQKIDITHQYSDL